MVFREDEDGNHCHRILLTLLDGRNTLLRKAMNSCATVNFFSYVSPLQRR